MSSLTSYHHRRPLLYGALFVCLTTITSFNILFRKVKLGDGSIDHRSLDVHKPPGNRAFPRVIDLSSIMVLSSHDIRKVRRGALNNTTALEFELPEIIREFGIPGHYRPFESKCKPLYKWQTETHPNCNTMHEVDFFQGIQKYHGDYPTRTERLSAGGTRDTWRLETLEYNTTTTLAFKTLRMNREYIWTRIDNQRKDATISEHLTASPYIIDIYGYCAAAAINEFGEQGTLDKFILSPGPQSSTERLEYARDIAYGMADIHEVDGHPSSVVQHDVKLVNVLMTANGTKAKISDFNNAKFRSQQNDGKLCPFEFRSSCKHLNIKPTAEECQKKGEDVTETAEVFELGFQLHFLLNPQEKYVNPDEPLTNPPMLPESIMSSDDLAVLGLKYAMEKAFTVKAKERPSARAIGDFLANVVSCAPSTNVSGCSIRLSG